MGRRWSAHIASSKSSKNGRWHFPNAIRKHGPQAFSHEVLEVCHSIEVANLAEECWIELYGTRDPAKGFNTAKGGGSQPHPVRNPWDRPEYRIKRSEASRRQWENLPFRERVQASRNITIATEESIRKRATVSKTLWNNSEFRTKTTASIKLKWQEPEYRSKVLTASRKSMMNNKIRLERELVLKEAGISGYRCRSHGFVPIEDCQIHAPRGASSALRLVCRFCESAM